MIFFLVVLRRLIILCRTLFQFCFYVFSRFWSQLVYDESVHKCLESYLTMAPRCVYFIEFKIIIKAV